MTGRRLGTVACIGLLAACGKGVLPPTGGNLAIGTWGGDNAGLIVGDTIAHVHVGCTDGNFPAPVAVDHDGRFNVPGSYLLRAYPIPIGPPLPAQLAGLLVGNRLTFTVAVNDTVEKKLVALGPVTVTLGTDPRLGPCPICRVPTALPGTPGLRSIPSAFRLPGPSQSRSSPPGSRRY